MTDNKKNYTEVTDIAGKHLGKVGGEGYKAIYDRDLLVAIPRELNREAYDLTGREFSGYDVWNAYEVSAITEKGLPVSGMLKIVCPAETPYHVESKSIKLYLNSFNMTKLGKDSKECIKLIEETVSKDLSELLKGRVEVKMHTGTIPPKKRFGFIQHTDIKELTDLDDIKFKTYKSDARQLHNNGGSTGINWRTDLLRSNCRVTNQPDWGDLFITMSGDKSPTPESLAKYVVSHREVSHFHEEIVEMVYKHLSDRFNPDFLMVAAFYTRRGGIDINPIRVSDRQLIPTWFYNPDCVFEKTLRQ